MRPRPARSIVKAGALVILARALARPHCGEPPAASIETIASRRRLVEGDALIVCAKSGGWPSSRGSDELLRRLDARLMTPTVGPAELSQVRRPKWRIVPTPRAGDRRVWAARSAWSRPSGYSRQWRALRRSGEPTRPACNDEGPGNGHRQCDRAAAWVGGLVDTAKPGQERTDRGSRGSRERDRRSRPPVVHGESSLEHRDSARLVRATSGLERRIATTMS
jgi:hypothetical protein